MSIASLKAHGSGALRYALVIEGWPHIFVTDPALTLSSSKGDRTVIAGLLYEGLRFSERAIPRDGKYEGSAITFKFRPLSTKPTSSGRTDPISASFSRRGTPVAAIDTGATLSESATTIVLQGSSTLSNSTYYYIGTETIKTATFPTIARAQFGSFAQIHTTTYIDSSRDVAVYDYPTTMDGRRVTLYLFEKGDSVNSLASGNVIWRGIVAMPPKRDSDGGTWSLYCNHISHAWRQSLVAQEVDVRIVGLYHHELAPVRVAIAYGSDRVASYVGGFHRSPAELCTAVNEKLLDALSDLSIATSVIEWMQLQYNGDVGQYSLVFATGASPPSTLFPIVGSVLIGANERPATYLASTGDPVLYTELAANKVYVSPLGLPVGADAINGGSNTVLLPSLESALAPASGLLGPNSLAYIPDSEQPADDDAIHGFPANRIYIDHDLSAISASNYISISADEVVFPADASRSRMARRGGVFRVDTTDEDADGNKYIEVTALQQNAGVGLSIGQFRGFLTGDTEIRILVDYSSTASFTYTVVDFLDAVTDKRIYSNDGITPFLTPDDFDTSQLSGNFPYEAIHRTFQFVEPVTIEDVVAHELLLTGHMLYTTTAGKLGVRPIPVFTDVHVTTKTVTGTKIITPADGYGSWPGYQLHPQGIVSTVHIKTGYEPSEDEWNGRSFEVRDPDLIARHKKRGVGNVEVAPRSNPSLGTDMEIQTAQQVAGVLLGFMGREYAAVTVEVPFTAFDYLLGDIVTLTSPHVPNAADGTVGLTGKRAVVMKREWNLDPKVEEWGTLEFWILLDAPVGYAPNAVITAQTNTSGNTWAITCSVANDINVRLSTAGDGLCLQHFADGDYVRVIERNQDPINQVQGRISGTPNASAGTCTVVFDATWTPGAGTWVLGFRVDNGSTAQTGQRSYCYIGDNNKQLANSVHARSFA